MAHDRTLLSESQLKAFLSAHPQWKTVDKTIERTYELRGFPDAIAFVTRVGFVAEANDLFQTARKEDKLAILNLEAV